MIQSSKMKSLLPLGVAFAACLSLLPSKASAQIINIDFIGTRTDSLSTPEPTPRSASGSPSGFLGGGTVYNDIVANDTADTDNLVVAGTNLLDSHGVATTENFTISPVGADNAGIGSLNGSYLFTGSAANFFNSVPFTISGLGTATSLNIIFFTTAALPNIPTVTFGAVTTPATIDANPNAYTYEYDNVAVTGGIVTGTIGSSNGNYPLILSGLAFQSASVPEPATWAMMGLGACFLGFALRRRNAVL